MVRNEGTVDRVLRVVAGLAILSQTQMGLHTPWAWIGIVPILTGLIGYCPAYKLIGLNTCPAKKA